MIKILINKRILCALIFVLAVSMSTVLFSQEQGAVVVGKNNIITQVDESALTSNKWHFLLEPYTMFSNINGTEGLGTLPNVTIDESPADIFKNLQFGAMLYTEARKGLWAITSDFIYMKLGSDLSSESGKGVVSGKAEDQQLGLELAGLYRVKPWLELGLGIQMNSIKSTMDLNVTTPLGVQPFNSEITENWIDPSIITRISLPLSRKIFFQFRGNIGGFDVGSKLYWQTQAYVGYRFSKLFQTSLGYRAIGINYENGSESDHFLYDTVTFGPVARFGFNF